MILIGYGSARRAGVALADPPPNEQTPGAPSREAELPAAAAPIPEVGVAEPTIPDAASGPSITSPAPPGPVIELAPGSTEPGAGSAAPTAGPRPATPPSEQDEAARQRDELLAYGEKPELQRAPATSIGGYGELHYNLEHVTGPGGSEAHLDLHRMVLFLAHRFDERLRFYGELEVEHAVAAPDTTGEVEIEQAYLDYLLIGEALGLRAGVVLVPMGIINSWHEPPIFHGVERPAVDTVIIPTTWREGGLGVFGQPVEGLRYQLYVMGGLDPAGFSAAQGIREGRTEVVDARADGLAVTGRVEVEPLLGLVAGASGYFGLAGPNADLYDLAGAKLKLEAPVFGFAADARVRRAGIEARAVFALFRVGDSAQLRQAMTAEGMSAGIDVGSVLWGTYGELAYDVLHEFSVGGHALLPFVRVERYDTMASIAGRRRTSADRAYAITDLVVGLTYRPIPQVAFKADFVRRNPDGPTPASGQADLGIGLMF